MAGGKKQEHDVVSYDAMDNGETVGAEAIRDLHPMLGTTAGM